MDVVTYKINQNCVLMYIENFIDAFDMERSKYKYNAKYDFILLYQRYIFESKRLLRI